VLSACDGRATESEIAGRLTDEFDVDEETATQDVEQLVTLFTEAGLLAPGTGPLPSGVGLQADGAGLLAAGAVR